MLQVVPNSDTFKRKSFSEISTLMNAFWESTSDELKVSFHKSARERGEVKLRFKAEVLFTCLGVFASS